MVYTKVWLLLARSEVPWGLQTMHGGGEVSFSSRAKILNVMIYVL